MTHAVDTLKAELKTLGIMGGISSLLNWDQETMMPAGAIESRAEQLALMSGLAHERHTGKGFEKALGACVDLETGDPTIDVDPRHQAMLREVHREWRLATCLPQDFVESYSKLCAQGQKAWQEARKADDFTGFAPFLSKIIDACKQKAEYIGYEAAPYDALLNEYEPGMTTAELKTVFKELRDGTMALLKRLDGGSAPDDAIIKQSFDLDKQWDVGVAHLKNLGYDFNTGRQDKSAHPFSTSFHPTDSRITTRFDEHNFLEGFLSTAHECGHALYEQGLPAEEFGNPLSQYISLGIHESQSRVWENQVSRSRAYWEGHYADVQSSFSDVLGKVSVDEFYRAIHVVKPSLIRTDADEVTYNLHVMVRFEIEQAMINESIDVNSLPERWNALYQEYLGVTPPNMADGVLQDVHWSMGGIGYFPTYSLGNLYSAQFFDTYVKSRPQWEADFKAGEFSDFLSWLRREIHSKGREFTAGELVERITGKPLDASFALNYLNAKYSGIYGV